MATVEPNTGVSNIEALLALDTACKQGPVFFYQIGKAYIDARQYGEAAAAFNAGLENPGDFAKELMLALGDTALHQHGYGPAAAKYKAVTDAYPQWYIGFDRLGFAYFASNNLGPAQEALERSIQLQESADAYRTLTLVYFQQGAFEKSINALNRGFSLNERLLGDRDFMVAGVRSYTELGRFDVARGLLAAMLKENRAITEDPEFVRAGMYLRSKMVAKGLIEE